MSRVHKNWCFTLFATDIHVCAALLKVHWESQHVCNYAIAGVETCPDTMRLHLQGYMQFDKRVGIATVLASFCTPEWSYRPHLEPQRAAHAKQAIVYCQKDGNVVLELGEANLDNPGKRNDLKRVREAIVEGKSLNDLFRDEPELYGSLVRYWKGVQRSIPAIQKRQARGEVSAEWHFGPTGSGKSYWAYAQAAEGEQAYTKDNSMWWDGYDGEELIIWDDIRGGYSAQFVDMLRLLDGRFDRGQVKGGYARITASRVIFTSPISIYEWGSKYAGSEDIRQLRRRVDKIVQYTGYKTWSVIKPAPAPAQVGHAAGYNP